MLRCQFAEALRAPALRGASHKSKKCHQEPHKAARKTLYTPNSPACSSPLTVCMATPFNPLRESCLSVQPAQQHNMLDAQQETRALTSVSARGGIPTRQNATPFIGQRRGGRGSDLAANKVALSVGVCKGNEKKEEEKYSRLHALALRCPVPLSSPAYCFPLGVNPSPASWD
ncbi:hypothetical protein MHYP_G00152010 [Metynnis hypsauchen]